MTGTAGAGSGRDVLIVAVASEVYGCEFESGYRDITAEHLDAIPDGWAKVDGEWLRITSDGVGYGEFDREATP